MIKCEVIENFTLKDFKKLKNIIRKGKNLDGHLYKEDTFECDEDMAKYLTGENADKKVVVKIIEVKPKKIIEESKEDVFEKFEEENIKPFIVGIEKDDVECVTPLVETKELDELKKSIEKAIKPKKKKTSKKK